MSQNIYVAACGNCFSLKNVNFWILEPENSENRGHRTKQVVTTEQDVLTVSGESKSTKWLATRVEMRGVLIRRAQAIREQYLRTRDTI